MAKQQTDVNKSEEIRKLLKTNPKVSAKEIVSTLAGQGIKVSTNLIYFIKGKMKGRKGRRRRAARQMMVQATATSNGDPVGMIRKVKAWASEVGGLKKLKALVDALIE